MLQTSQPTAGLYVEMLPGSAFTRALHEAAPRLSRRLFSCQCQHLRQQQLFGGVRSAFRSHASTSPSQPSQSRSRLRTEQKIVSQSIRAFSSTTRQRVGNAAAQGIKSTKPSKWPQTNSNVVAYWLLGSAASVFGIVVFGGLTRLTESGYAIAAKPFAYVLTLLQPLYNRMEARHRLTPSHVRSRLGL